MQKFLLFFVINILLTKNIYQLSTYYTDSVAICRHMRKNKLKQHVKEIVLRVTNISYR